jgi:hypothetical protein
MMHRIGASSGSACALQEEKTMKTLTLLVTARALIADASDWCKGVLTYEGKHCLVGALNRVACGVDKEFQFPLDYKAIRPAMQALQEAIPDGKVVPTPVERLINRHPDTLLQNVVANFNNQNKHEEVLAVLDLAIARQLVIDSMANKTELLVEPDEFNKAMKSALLVGV